MCAPVQCQVSFEDVFDGMAQSEAAIFIVSMTALMMSDPFCLRCLEMCWVVENKTEQKGWFSPLHVAISGALKLYEQRSLLTDVAVFSQNCLLMFSWFSFMPLISIVNINLMIFKSFLVWLHRFYSSPYSISTNRMIAQTSITPFIAASPVSTYQVGGPPLKFTGLHQAFKSCKGFWIVHWKIGCLIKDCVFT